MSRQDVLHDDYRRRQNPRSRLTRTGPPRETVTGVNGPSDYGYGPFGFAGRSSRNPPGGNATSGAGSTVAGQTASTGFGTWTDSVRPPRFRNSPGFGVAANVTPVVEEATKLPVFDVGATSSTTREVETGAKKSPTEAKTTEMPTPTGKSNDSDADITLSCPVCMEGYSDDRFPVVLAGCGHSVCNVCSNHHTYGAPCMTCGKIILRATGAKMVSMPGMKNYALLDLVNLHHAIQASFAEARTKYEDKEKQLTMELTEFRMRQNEEDEAKEKEVYMECTGCKTKEKRERMSICQTCTGKGNLDWTGIGEEEVLPHLLCAFCCYCRDEHNGHICRNYVQWKIKKLFTSTISEGQAMVASMDEVCAYEIEKGKEKLEKWNEAVQLFDSIEANVSYEDGVLLADALTKETELVCDASEKTMSPLRRFTKILTDSTGRLEQWIENVKEGKPINIESIAEESPSADAPGESSESGRAPPDDVAVAACDFPPDEVRAPSISPSAELSATTTSAANNGDGAPKRTTFGFLDVMDGW